MTDHTPSGLPQPQTVAVLRMALACIRWQMFGECRTEGWTGSPPAPSATAEAIEAALSAPAVETVAVQEAYRVFLDGNQWCAVGPDFVDLQQSPSGFADTPYRALELLTEEEAEQKRRAYRAASPLPVAPKAEPTIPTSPKGEANGGAEAPKGAYNCPICGKDTPHHHSGMWTLTAPDGRQWHGDTPIRACREEQRSRIPDSVAYERVMQAAQQAAAKDSKIVKLSVPKGAILSVECRMPEGAAPTGPELTFRVARNLCKVFAESDMTAAECVEALDKMAEGLAHPHEAADRSAEARDAAYEAAMDAWDKAVPHYLRGFAEWCDRFDAARKAFDAAMGTPAAAEPGKGQP